MQCKLIADLYNFVVLTPTIRAIGNIHLKFCFFKMKFGQVEAEVMFESDTSWKEALGVCVLGGEGGVIFNLFLFKKIYWRTDKGFVMFPNNFFIGGLEVSITFMLSYLCAPC